MATAAKLVREIEVKCDCNLIYEFYKNNLKTPFKREKILLMWQYIHYHNPYDSVVTSPDKIHRCELVDGQWGTSGSVILWHYIHDGKKETSKEMIEVDDESQKIVFKVIEGDVLEAYNPCIAIFNVKKVNDKNLVILTIEYEKVNASIDDPVLLMDLLCAMVEDVDAHFLKKP